MRLLKIMLIPLILGMLVTPLLGCGSKSASTALPGNQVVTVQTGNITTAITAAGNLALSKTEELPITLFYQGGSVGRGGTVEQVLVEVGDTVKKGQVLVTIDASEWDDQLNTLEKALITAERNLTTKQSALTTAKRQLTAKESAVTVAQRLVTTKEFAVSQAHLNVETAENNLEQIAEVKEAQDHVDDAELNLKMAIMALNGELAGVAHVQNDFSYLSDQVANARQQLTDANNDLEEILDGTSVNVESDVALQVAKYQLLIKQSQMALEDARTAVETAKSGVVDAQLDVEDAKSAVSNAQLNVGDAEQSVQDAKDKLAKAQGMSPEIKAPFDGFITAINVKAGDNVYNGTIALTLADPNKFETNILVNEMDMAQVKLEGEARVSVNAIQGISLPANVTQIAPTATISSGVVNYAVTVEIQPFEAAASALTTRQSATSDNASRQFQGPPAGSGVPSGNTTRPGRTSTGQATIPQNFQLRQGLSATVSIIVSQKTNVLVVPNAAITSQGRQSYVQVLLPNGTTEQRAIQTGITDYQHIEVTKGLSEGEKVVVPKGTTTTTTTTSQSRPPGGILFGR